MIDNEQRIAIEIAASARKRRLYAVACCRRIWPLLTDERSRQAVEVAEQYAEGLASDRDLTEARKEATAAVVDTGIELDDLWHDNPTICAAYAVMEATSPDESVRDVIYFECDRRAGTAAWAMGIREKDPFCWDDIFGGYISQWQLVDHWLSPEVLRIARLAYEEKDFETLPILANALEAVGCKNAELLAHCRGSGPHVRGCWAVDALLGKE